MKDIFNNHSVYELLFTLASFFGAFYIKQLTETIKTVSNSISSLNEKIAVIIERTETHATEISTLRAKQELIHLELTSIKSRQDKHDKQI